MLKFYRKDENNFTRWVERKLEEMVVAHKLVKVEENPALPADISQRKLPVLSDGHKQWITHGDIKDYLKELNKNLQLSRSLQSDTCYLDPENSDKCL